MAREKIAVKEEFTSDTDEKLIDMHHQLELSIYEFECYSVGDVMMINRVEEELIKRGYTAETQHSTKWIKKGEEDE